ITVNPPLSFEAVRKSVSELKERLEDLCKGEMAKISGAGRGVGSYSCFTQTRGSSGGKATAAEGETCPLCRGCFQKKQRLKCTHAFCAECVRRSVESLGLLCPVCHKPLSYIGDQPEGEMKWKLKKTGLQAAPPAHCYAGPGDVACDVCTGRKLKAVKSCLGCLASYCETHLQPHYQSPAFKKHKLVQATGNLQEKICSHHNRVLEIYCRTDQQCICYLCTIEDHRGHDTVSTITAKTEKQKQLGVSQKDFQNKIQQRQKEVEDLRQAVQSLKRSAQAAVEDSERVFTELIRSIERRRSEVKELIRDQEKAAVSRAEGLLERLEQEIAELRRRDAELEQLSHTEDHINFLQPHYQSPPLKKHKLVQATGDLQEKICSLHDKALEIYCRTDQQCICYLCTIENHRGHDTKQLGVSQKDFQSKIQQRQKEAEDLRQAVESLKRSAQAAVEDSERIFTELIRSIERRCSEVKELIRDQEKAAVSEAEGLLERLEQEIAELRRRDAELEQLSHTEDHIHFLQVAHPNPGKPFTGITANAFLPATPEGKRVLQLLQRAFNQKLIFTVEATSEDADRVVYTDIPHTYDPVEASTSGFLEKVKAALRAKGIE
ncbi:hypothetical protein JZ751_029587, partial [Albula glossodonta]